jgi:type I restriction enzyme S subunit
MRADRLVEVALGTLVEPVLRPVPIKPEARYRLLGVRWYGNGCRLHSEVVGAELKTAQLNRVERGDIV